MAIIYTLNQEDLNKMDSAGVKLFHLNMWGEYVEAGLGFNIETDKWLVIASNNELKVITEELSGSSYEMLNAFFYADAFNMFGEPIFTPTIYDDFIIETGADIDSSLDGYEYAISFDTGSDSRPLGNDAGFYWVGSEDSGGDSENVKTLTSYLVDYDKLKEINRARFLYNSEKDLLTDLANNIINVVQLPLDLSELVGDSINVVLGGYTLKDSLGDNLKAYELETTILNVDLGQIILTGNGDFNDYEGVKAFLMLPYYGEVEIPLNVAYKGFSIGFRINLANNSTVIILSDYDGVVFNNLAVDLGARVPISHLLGGSSFNRSDSGGGGFNGIYKPFLRVERYPLMESLTDKALVAGEGVIGDESGYIEVESVKIDSLSKNDYLEVLELLKQGVYI